ncbi:MAG: DUF3789 domain-containing protein [Ruminococcus flavefaciens]|nr:DUF3789 domain-containing protein [Ruminococcus flavefaciens]MCM1361348.1 DUF3789 domain-containing protein [Clostridiales bacterium]
MSEGNNGEFSNVKRMGDDTMTQFILGCFTGGIIGVFAMCLCQAAGQADRELNCTEFDE